MMTPTIPPTLDPDKFVAAANDALQKGWAPVPIGQPVKDKPAGKAPWLRRLTGRSGVDATPETIVGWPATVARLIARQGGILNLGTRMPATGAVGLDVDTYDDKRGAQTLADHEHRLGQLPPTVRVTARAFETGSGIRLYRVPPRWIGHDLKAPDGSPGDVELIQRHHRVAAIPPSVHHTGQPYACYDERTGEPCDLPTVETLPALPVAWLTELGRNAKAGADRVATPAEVAAFAEKHTADRWPSMLDAVVSRVSA